MQELRQDIRGNQSLWGSCWNLQISFKLYDEHSNVSLTLRYIKIDDDETLKRYAQAIDMLGKTKRLPVDAVGMIASVLIPHCSMNNFKAVTCVEVD